MAEYIELEAAKMAVVKALGKGYSPFNAIVMLPAADVVPVVRCKICRSQRWCKFAQYLGNDGFCSQGEYATNCGALMDKDGDA